MSLAAIGGASLLQIPTVAAVMAFAPKIILVIAIIQVVRKVLSIVINLFIYPAVLKHADRSEIDNQRWETFETLKNEKFECRRIALNKSGFSYDAFVYEHEDIKGNGQWAVVAGGNIEVGEFTSDVAARKFKDLGFNVLYVNGPGIGRSSGFPTSYSIGAGQEAGLQFLENGIGAKKILHYGMSLGGGAQAEVGIGQSNEEAKKYFKMAAMQGYAEAFGPLAEHYQYGIEPNQPYEETLNYIGELVKHGNSIFQHNLGVDFAKGENGLKQSFEEAFKCFKLAAAKGYPPSQFLVGAYLKKGRGIDQSYEDAFKYFKLAADNGHKESQQAVGIYINKDRAFGNL